MSSAVKNFGGGGDLPKIWGLLTFSQHVLFIFSFLNKATEFKEKIKFEDGLRTGNSPNSRQSIMENPLVILPWTLPLIAREK